jgi:hypothetical protein
MQFWATGLSSLASREAILSVEHDAPKRLRGSAPLLSGELKQRFRVYAALK